MLVFEGLGIAEVGLDCAPEVDPSSGAVSAGVAFKIPKGRDGFGPKLALSSTSSGGNSAFGVGWALSGLLSIQRSTRDGLPLYVDEDRFDFAGQELAIELAGAGDRVPVERDEPGHRVRSYRVREGDQRIRIERWTSTADGRVHWRTRDTRNCLTIYGAASDGSSRIADPAAPARVFEWLPDLQVDRLGNAIAYQYASETFDGVDFTKSSERSRRRSGLEPAQRYLKAVRYGNSRPVSLPAGPAADLIWHYQLVLDYGDHPDDRASPSRSWPARPDPFSTYRPGFELRTWRLCRRLLVFHAFQELGAEPALVAVHNLTHDLRPDGAILKSVNFEGVRPDTGARRSTPPVSFGYSGETLGGGFSAAFPDAIENLPTGFAGAQVRWADLLGEGLPGILAETRDGWFFKRNLGGGHFGPQQVVEAAPRYRFADGAISDFDGDGNLDLAVLHGRLAGYFQLDREDEHWSGFTPLPALAHLEQARGHWLDLSGDGRADLMFAADGRLVWFPSEGKEGFGGPREAGGGPAGGGEIPVGEATGIGFFLADMTGDGLVDQVRIASGRIEYYPNLGNGRFGDPVLMDDAPDFGAEFDPQRLFLVDLDRNGASDLIHVGAGEIRLYRNIRGNGWQDWARIAGLPVIDRLASLRLLDFLGDGTPCLVWSDPLPASASPIQYLPLGSPQHPWLLASVDNGRGARTTISYESSALHYLRAEAEGRPWRTRLPTHVTVASTIVHEDLIAGTRTVQRFAYRDGSFDGDRRLFRGFAIAERRDQPLRDSGDGGEASGEGLLTRSFFAHDASMPAGWAGDQSLDPPPPIAVTGAGELSEAEYQDALRAASGRLVRTEQFAVAPDGTAGEVPLRVDLRSYEVACLQRSSAAQRAVFAVDCNERLEAVYERQPVDPRITHELVLQRDEHSHETLDATINYGRSAPDAPEQAPTWITARIASFIHLSGADNYQLGLPAEDKGYEVRLQAPQRRLYRLAELRSAVPALLAAARPFDQPLQGGSPAARLMSWSRHFYWNDAGDAPLPLGEAGELALEHSVRDACFTPAFFTGLYAGRVTGAELSNEGGYSLEDGHWWRSDAVTRYSPAEQFRRAIRAVQVDGAETRLGYDPSNLFIVRREDALGNVTSGEIDLVALAPRRITDPNGNSAEVAYDPLGVIVATSATGSLLSEGGQSHGYGHDPLASAGVKPAANIAEVLADPAGHVGTAAQAIYYDLDAFGRDGSPSVVLTVARTSLTHDGTGAAPPDARPNISIAYLDGSGGEAQSKVRVEPGPAIQRDGAGKLVVDGAGEAVLADAAERWIASGHVVRDERGQPIRQFEPFFTPTSAYEPDAAIRQFGQSSTTHFDALGRSLVVNLPNGTLTRFEYGAWEKRIFDANDCVGGSAYALLRDPLPADNAEKRALVGALAHNDTPTIIQYDARGYAAREIHKAGAGDEDRIGITRHDAFGNVEELVDARGVSAVRYRLDMCGRTLSSASADAGEALLFPDALDRPLANWDARGAWQRRSFDALGRLTGVRAGLDGEAGTLVETYGYGEDPAVADAAGRNLRQRLVLRRDLSGTREVLRANPAGAILASEQRIRVDYQHQADWTDPAAVELLADSYRTESAFDALQRLVRQKTPDGLVRHFSHLAGGGLAELVVEAADGSLGPTTLVDSIVYNARGQEQRARFGNGVTRTHGHDPLSFRVTSIAAKRADGTAIQDLRYTYDPVGNIVIVRDLAQEAGAAGPIANLAVTSEQAFTYDAFYALRRSTGRVHRALLEHDYRFGAAGTFRGTRTLSLNDGAAVDRYTRSYDYDLAGNIRRISHNSTVSWATDMWVAASSNRSLPQNDTGGGPFANPENRFDASGNVTSLPHLASMRWDPFGRLARAVVIDRGGSGDPDDCEYYVYDADGRRSRKVAQRLTAGGLETIDKLYLDACEIKRISRGGNLVLERTTSHFEAEDGVVAQLHRWTRDDSQRETDNVGEAKWLYRLSNHLGSASLDLDSAGGVIAYEEYFPFGGTAFIAGDNLKAAAWRDYRFNGKERDDGTGFHYYGARYYAAWLGRWLSPDPAGADGGINLYQYADNNPVNLIDPEGLDPQRPGGRIRTRYVSYEQFIAAVPEEHRGEFGPNSRWVGLFTTGPASFTFHRDEASFREAGRRQGATEMWIYDPRYQEGIDRGLSPRASEARAESLHSIEEVLASLRQPPPSTPPVEDESGLGGEGSGSGAGGGGGGTGGGGSSGQDGGGDTDGSTGGQQGGQGGGGDGGGQTSQGTDSTGQGGTSGQGSGSGGSGSGASNSGQTGDGGQGGDGGGSGTGLGNRGSGSGGGGTSAQGIPGAQGTGSGTGTGTGTGDGDAASGQGEGGGGTGTGSGGEGDHPDGGSGGGTHGGGSTAGGTGTHPGGRQGGVQGGTGTGTGTTRGTGDPGGSGSEGGDGASGGTSREGGAGTPGGTDPNGSSKGTPPQTTESPNPEGGNGSGSGSASGSGTQGGRPNGSPEGTPDGTGERPPGNSQGGSGQGQGGPQTVMDRISRIAGYWHLQFHGEPGGESGGIPGGMGSHNWGWIGQAAFVALTVVDIALTVASFGGLAGIKAGLKTLVRGAMAGGRRAITALVRVGTRAFWREAAAGASRFGWGLRNFIFNRGQAFRRFVGDSGLFMTRVQPGARAIADEILKDAANHIVLPRSVLTEIGAGKLSSRLRDSWRLLTSRANIEIVEDAATNVITHGKFGAVDFEVVSQALNRGLSVVTTNVKMAQQIRSFEALRKALGSVRIFGVGTDIKTASDLARLIP